MQDKTTHLADGAQDLPVLPRVAEQRHGRARGLHPPLHVDVRARLLRVGRTGQHHVRAAGALVAVVALWGAVR